MTYRTTMEVTYTKSEDQWLQARMNRFTASVIYKLMGNSRSGGLLSQTATTFVYEKGSGDTNRYLQAYLRRCT
jgi:hypothetical protein